MSWLLEGIVSVRVHDVLNIRIGDVMHECRGIDIAIFSKRQSTQCVHCC
jgi:hypothetical protein